MVRVCDAIMGTGKTSAAINYMNEHPEKRFIYVTPYLDEVDRILTACREVNFFEPEQVEECMGSKTLHTMVLVDEYRNIATTHQAFKFYPKELMAAIADQHYTLIVDEAMDNLEEIKDDAADIQMAIDAGYLVEVEPGEYELRVDVYDGKTHKDLFRIARSRKMVRLRDKDGNKAFYWKLPPELFTMFDDAYILTYMFEGQSLWCCLKINNIEFDYIGVEKHDDGTYHFDFTGENRYVPEYTKNIFDLITVLNNSRLNDVGEDYYAMSVSWFDEKNGHAEEIAQLSNNCVNYFKNKVHVTKKERAWSTFLCGKERVKGKGYTKGFIPFNEKATNKYSHIKAAAYCVNIFPNSSKEIYCRDHGAKMDKKNYALSTMIQWIWRFAVRNGEPIYLYVPSRRMREMLLEWMEEVRNGTNV